MVKHPLAVLVFWLSPASLEKGRRLPPASRRREAPCASLLTGDGLHYTGPMYLEWARLALPTAAGAISPQRP